MGAALKRLGIAAVPQYPVPRTGRYLGRYYYIDFAIVDRKIAIECDGRAWHTSSRAVAADRRRQLEMERMGWRFIRFTGSQIVTNMPACEQVLRNFLKGTP